MDIEKFLKEAKEKGEVRFKQMEKEFWGEANTIIGNFRTDLMKKYPPVINWDILFTEIIKTQNDALKFANEYLSILQEQDDTKYQLAKQEFLRRSDLKGWKFIIQN